MDRKNHSEEFIVDSKEPKVNPIKTHNFQSSVADKLKNLSTESQTDSQSVEFLTTQQRIEINKTRNTEYRKELYDFEVGNFPNTKSTFTNEETESNGTDALNEALNDKQTTKQRTDSVEDAIFENEVLWSQLNYGFNELSSKQKESREQFKQTIKRDVINFRNDELKNLLDMLNKVVHSIDERHAYLKEILRENKSKPDHPAYRAIVEDIDSLSSEWNLIQGFKNLIIDHVQQIKESASNEFADSVCAEQEFNEAFNLALKEAKKAIQSFINQRNEFADLYKNIQLEIDQINQNFIRNHARIDDLVAQIDSGSYKSFEPESSHNYERIDNEVQRLNNLNQSLANRKDLLDSKLLDAKQKVDRAKNLINEKKELLDTTVNSYKENIANFSCKLSGYLQALDEVRSNLQNPRSLIAERYHAAHSYLEARDMEIANTISSLSWDLNVNHPDAIQERDNSIEDLRAERYRLSLEMEVLDVIVATGTSLISKVADEIKQNLQRMNDFTSSIDELIVREENEINDWILKSQNDDRVSLNFAPLKQSLLNNDFYSTSSDEADAEKSEQSNLKLTEQDLYTKNINDVFYKQPQNENPVNLNTNPIINNHASNPKVNVVVKNNFANDKAKDNGNDQNYSLMRFFNDKENEIDKLSFKISQNLFEKNPIDKILSSKRDEAKKYLRELNEIKELLRDQKEILIKNGQVNLANIDVLNSHLVKSAVDIEINRLIPESVSEDLYECVADVKRTLRKEQIALESDLQISCDHANRDVEELKQFIQTVNDDQNSIDIAIENLINNRMSEFHRKDYDAITSPLCESITDEWKNCKENLLKLEEKRNNLTNRFNVIHSGIERYIKRLLDQKADISNLQLVNNSSNNSIQKHFEIKWHNDKLSDLAKKIQNLSSRHDVLNDRWQKVQKIAFKNNVEGDERINRIKREISAISENRNEINEFCIMLLKSLNELFDQFLSLKREVETLNNNHNIEKQKHDESITRSFAFISNEINNYQDERQRRFKQMKMEHDRLAKDEMHLDKQVKELIGYFRTIKESANSTKELTNEQRLELEKMRREQRALLNEKERIKAERKELLYKVREYENRLRHDDENYKDYRARIDQLLRENSDLKKNYESQNEELKKVIQELINRSQYLDESQQDQLLSLQGKYQELKRFNESNKKMRDDLERSYREYTRDLDKKNSDLNSRNRDLLADRLLRERALTLNKQVRDLKAKESKYEGHRQNLMRSALRMRLDLERYNQLMHNNDQNLLEAELNQRLRDHEIHSLLRKLNDASNKLSQAQLNELSNIRIEHQKLELKQAQLNEKIKLASDDISRIQLLRSDPNNRNTPQLDQQYDYLINQRAMFNSGLLGLENMRSNLVDRLHRLENYVEIKRQKEKMKNTYNTPHDQFEDIERKEFDYELNPHEQQEQIIPNSFGSSQLNMDDKLHQLNKQTDFLENRAQKLMNNENFLRDRLDECNEMKQVIAQEQVRLDEAKNKAIETLKNYHNDLDQKKSKLKSLYEKIKFVRDEQAQRQKKLNDIAVKYDSDIQRLKRIKDKIKQREDDFRVRRHNEMQRIKGIYQVLLNRQAELDKIKSELKTQKDQLEETKKDKLKRIERTHGCRNHQNQCQVHSNLGAINMNKHLTNNNLSIEGSCTCDVNRTIIPYNDLVYQPNGLNQVIQIQQLLQHQQIHMLNQEHRMKLDESNRRRQELENKLQEVLRWQERARDYGRYYGPMYGQECVPPMMARMNHSQCNAAKNNSVNKEAVQEMLKRFAEKTKNQLTEMKESINELKQTTVQHQKQAHQEIQSLAYPNYVRDEYMNDSLNRQRDELAMIEQRNMKILDEIKQMVNIQREAFNRERQLLIDEFKRRNELRNRALDEKEKNFKNILNQMVGNFNQEIATIRRDKQNLANKLQETRNASYRTRMEANNESLQTKNLLESTHKILADERETFAREREALMQEILSSTKQCPEEAVVKSLENKNKKNTISRLSEQIKNIKDMLNK